MDLNDKTPRRDFFKKSITGTVALSAGVSLTASLLQSLTANAEPITADLQQPVAANERQFRMGVIGPAELSLITSKIAVDKASQKNAKEFAGFELTEAIAVTGVLKDLGTPVPPMTEKAK